MREEDIRWENERYYYCEQYVYSWPAWLRKLMPILFVIIMTCVSCEIKNMFLEQFFFQQAGTMVLDGDMDVMRWVDLQVAESRWDDMTLLILGFNLAILITIVCAIFFKSYKLYKRGWIKAIPIILYIIEFVVMFFYYYRNTKIFGLLLAMFVNALPVILSSRLLYPLESRPRAKGEIGLDNIFDLLAKWVIQKL